MQARIPRDIWLPLVLALAVLTVFGRGLVSPFLFDDPFHVSHNPFFQSESPLAEIWTKPYFGLYVPLVYSAWYGLWQIAGGEAWPFHLLNLALHALNSVLVYRILRASEASPGRSFLAAALFAFHPLQVESVVWISEARGLMASSLTLAALGFWLKAQAARGFVSQAASLLAKPSTAFVPLAVAAASRLRGKKMIAFYWPLAAVVAGIGALAFAARLQNLPVLGSELDILARLELAIASLGFLTAKIVWPWPLSVDYGLTPARLLPTRYWIAGVAMGLTWIALFRRAKEKQNPTALTGLLLFALAWFPLSGLFATGFQSYSVVADRYAYLPLAGLAIAVASLIRAPQRPRVWRFAGAALVLVLAGLSFHQTRIWKDAITLFTHAVDVDENGFLAQSNLAWALYGESRIPEAYEHFRAANKILPIDAGPLVGVMLCLTKTSDHPASIRIASDALRHEEFLRYNQSSVHLPKLYFTLGYNHAQLGQWPQAYEAFCRSKELSRIGPPEPGVLANIEKLERSRGYASCKVPRN